MWIPLTLLGAVISVTGMLLVAWRWKLSVRSVFIGAMITSCISSLPALWIHRSFNYDWWPIAAIGIQAGLAMTLGLAMILLRFWRDPERTPPQENGVIVAPADGQVIYVILIPDGSAPLVTKNSRDYCLHELVGTELQDNGMLAIGIEMNILNVHVNRCPIEGDVKLVKHIRGRFSSLRNKEAPFVNARCTTLIRNQALTVAIVQIASRLVRKVDNYLHVGQTVAVGQRLGMIRFGSQVVVLFPNRERLGLEVQIGQSVIAGTSILAHYSV